jgi:protein-S-isoprenylcysteine O-methyltransferase Ste14
MSTVHNEIDLYWIVLWSFAVFAVIAFVSLQFVSAPYGRHMREGWGPKINATLGWIVMEAPSPLTFLACWLVAEPARRFSATGIVFLVMWQTHYLYRSFVFPFRRRGGTQEMPLSIVLMSIVFNLANGYLNARWIYTIGPERPTAWLVDPRFLGGLALFAFGWAVNHQSDRILFALREPGAAGRGDYKIPYGGFFRFVSCPNYFGELVEWTGWALCTFSPAGLTFALGSAANLVPRARQHHRWYREKFADYPRERKAIVPFIF